MGRQTISLKAIDTVKSPHKPTESSASTCASFQMQGRHFS
jgi:hypothetical protein